MRWRGDGFDVGNGNVLSEEGKEADHQEESQEAQREAVMTDLNVDLLRVVEDTNTLIQTWRESGREPVYGQWLNLQEAAQVAIAKVKVQTASQGGSKQ